MPRALAPIVRVTQDAVARTRSLLGELRNLACLRLRPRARLFVREAFQRRLSLCIGRFAEFWRLGHPRQSPGESQFRCLPRRTRGKRAQQVALRLRVSYHGPSSLKRGSATTHLPVWVPGCLVLLPPFCHPVTVLGRFKLSSIEAELQRD